MGFLRISTNQRLWKRPKTVAEAWEPIKELLGHPGVFVVEPGKKHLEILRSLTEQHQSTGPKMTDAVLAALAMENNAVLASTDQGFARFSDLRWLNPLA